MRANPLFIVFYCVLLWVIVGARADQCLPQSAAPPTPRTLPPVEARRSHHPFRPSGARRGEHGWALGAVVDNKPQ